MLTRKFRQLLSTSLVACATIAPNSLAQVPNDNTVIKHIDYISVDSATTLSQRLDQVDAVIVAVIESSTPRFVRIDQPWPEEIAARDPKINAPDVVTAHTIVVHQL